METWYSLVVTRNKLVKNKIGFLFSLWLSMQLFVVFCIF